MDLSALLVLGLIVGLILGLVGGIAHVAWQLTHKDGYWKIRYW
jgi:hypothetical protein